MRAAGYRVLSGMIWPGIIKGSNPNDAKVELIKSFVWFADTDGANEDGDVWNVGNFLVVFDKIL